MVKLIMLSGVAGSGKSTLAKKLAEKENAIILSSDEINKGVTGDYKNSKPNVGKTFELIYKMANEHLKKGINVIIDSTNIGSKKRKGVLQQFKNCEKEIYQLITPYEECLKRNSQRDRKVSKDVIKEMYLNIKIPYEVEGFDKCYYLVNEEFQKEIKGIKKEEIETLLKEEASYDELFKCLNKIKCFKDIYDLPQDSSYHSFSVSRHTYHVLKYIDENYIATENEKLKMQYAALFHDVGKKMAKNFGDGKKYASFYGHENVSAQICFGILTHLGYEEEFVKEVANIVQLHMRLPRKDATEKQWNKFNLEVLDEKLKENLFLFREADESAK